MSKAIQQGYRLSILLGLLVLAGCGQRDLPKKQTYAVSGRVTLHGEPAKYVHVHLEPKDPLVGMPAEGGTAEDGTFNLKTYSNAEPDGAVAGEYEVVISDGSQMGDDFVIRVPKGAVPTKIPQEIHDNFSKSVVIKAGENDLQIDIP
jgi:hypothetical protein